MSLIPVYVGDPLPGSGVVGGGEAATQEVVVAAYRGAGGLRSQVFYATAIASICAQANPARRTVSIQNLGANDVYIGGEGVTITNGWKLAANKDRVFEVAGAIWCITASTTEELRIMEESA